MQFDLSLFIGKFHPLFVHLPIGIILITLVLEWLGKSSERTLNWLWFFSFASALFTIISGWQIANSSSYPDGLLFNHRWLGVAIMVLSLLIWIARNNGDLVRKKLVLGLQVVLFLVLSLGGHFGGQLTHGSDYLIESAPGFVQKVAGYQAPKQIDLSSLHVDSISTYENLIAPILEQKCVTCHNAKAMNGDLDMSSPESLMLGGDNGTVIVPRDFAASEVFRRVTLSQNNVKFMPTKGTPLSYNEVGLLKWWLENGASFEEMASSAPISKEMIQSINAMYKIDLTPRPWYEKETGPSLDTSIVNKLRAVNYKVNSYSDNFVELVAANETLSSSFSLSDLDQNIVILDLKNSVVNEQTFKEIGRLSNVIRIQLQKTNTKSEDILSLPVLPRLESINLFGTEVGNDVLMHLAKFPSLKRIYTWQTNVTDEGISALKESRKDINVENGI